MLGISNACVKIVCKLRKLQGTLLFSIPRIDIDVQPPDNASLDPPVATDMQGEQDGARGDCTDSTEG